MDKINISNIDKKWQSFWSEKKNKFKNTDKNKKFYCLEMFPYPSGKIHMGHVRNYAIGDVTTTPYLAHKASYQGNIAAEAISGKDVTKFLKDENIPGCTYSNPQIASIGLTEEKALKDQEI